ncbi:Nucleoside diphosphate kinase [Helicobacter bizzozeronii CCUG 35545]|nr:Nucleoside diphosphate kinase [Helicobacter bizzozeronii CCUG 35545]
MVQTLSIIKPDGVKKKIIGKIITRFEEAGLEVVKIKRMHLSATQAQDFLCHPQRSPLFQGFDRLYDQWGCGGDGFRGGRGGGKEQKINGGYRS